MAKIGETAADIAVMSEKMLQSVKSEIAKFGFTPHEYEKFLVSVKAMKDDDTRTVMAYPNSRLEKYREKFVKKHEHGLNDIFMFDKYAKGKDTFCPRSFWDKVLDM